jgi:O-antigen ligase
MDDIVIKAFSISIGFILMILIFTWPYLGIVFTLTSLPVVDLLPAIPFFSSAVVLIGAVTLAAFLLQKLRQPGKSRFHFGSVHFLGLLFVGWIFFSNPQAALYGVERNWLLTFAQLWILIWLTGELLDSPKKQHVFMWLFSIVAAISAVISIQQGNIGETVSTSTRALGLAGSPNSSGRYFVVAMIFFSYLSTIAEKRFPRFLAIGGAILTFLGVFFTLSRTSIILLLVAIGLLIILNARRKFSLLLFVAYCIAALVLWYLSDNIFHILNSIMPSILLGTDTVGLRYRLWQDALRMWQDHRIFGVGIGMFAQLIKYYDPYVTQFYAALGAHNTYLMVLAETGLIGFCLFMPLLILSLRNFLQSSRIDDVGSIALRNVWLIVFLVVLVGEATANGTQDKLLWFLIGVSAAIHNQYRKNTAARIQSGSVQIPVPGNGVGTVSKTTILEP